MPGEDRVPGWVYAIFGLALGLSVAIALLAMERTGDLRRELDRHALEVDKLEESVREELLWHVDLKAFLRERGIEIEPKKENEDEPNTRRTP